MNKVEFELELTGLKMKFKGSREDMKEFSSNFGHQLTGLIQPTTSTDDREDKQILTEDVDVDIVSSPSKGRKGKRPRVNSNGNTKSEKSKPIDFRNDVANYSSPTQKWTTLEKALWILYAVEAQASVQELSAGEITETYNKHFRQAGIIRASNVSRDLGAKKAGSNALVGENASVSPNTWYLLEEGKKVVRTLIANEKGNGAS